ncbi:ElyC/SanA/YdcF family protein [Actinoplanes sp. NPDC051633]|uniref:SanA/YdcF family protein n=1 Tax=Actinoplanes sp. NPDC051633 TaxID=3155670 RepID=UPI00341B3CB3
MKRRRLLRRGVIGVVLLALVLIGGPWAWTEFAAAGHEHDVDGAPSAGVVIVLGTEVVDGQPSSRLAGRLETAAELVRGRRARAVLVSGDGSGGSGDEPAAITAYLVRLGVDPRQVVPDPYGLDTYDSCVRARDVYGVTSALVVTQSYHLSRAVALCRDAGLIADGVRAGCPGCPAGLLREKAVRDVLACVKAAWDAASGRDPAVTSPANPTIREALA